MLLFLHSQSFNFTQLSFLVDFMLIIQSLPWCFWILLTDTKRLFCKILLFLFVFVHFWSFLACFLRFLCLFKRRIFFKGILKGPPDRWQITKNVHLLFVLHGSLWIEEERFVEFVMKIDMVLCVGNDRRLIEVVRILEGGGAESVRVWVADLEELVKVDFHFHQYVCVMKIDKII